MPHPPLVESPTRLEGLDALRGLAALAVALYHMCGPQHLTLRHDTWHWVQVAIMEYAPHGAEFFFVLSGFVITNVLLRSPMDTATLKEFLAKRVVRIAPPYWCTMVLAVLLLMLSTYAASGNIFVPDVLVLASNATFLQMFFGHTHVVEAFWTLCYEMQFYLALALMLWLAARYRAMVAVHVFMFAMFVISLLFRSHLLDPEILRPWVLFEWYSFCLGIMGCFLIRGAIPVRLFFGYLGVFAVVMYFRPATCFQVVALALLLIYLCCTQPRFNRGLASRPLLFLGTISYSFYLIHIPIGGRVMNLGGRIVETPLQTWALVLAALVISVIASIAMYHWVEKPAIQWSRAVKFAKRGDDPRP